MKNIDRWIFVILLVLIVIFGRQLLVGGKIPKTYEHKFTELDPDNFSDSININNQWFPLKPGNVWVYEGKTKEGSETLAHRIEFSVTDLTKEIEGVRTLVAWIVDINDGEVVEKELAFFAQDNNGNVWYFGEYPEEYQNGEFVDAPTWIAGRADAKAGIKMWAEPKLETPSYFQGWGPQVEWSDYSYVDAVGEKLCVSVDCFEDVLVIAESSLEEKDAFQLKYYAKGIGNIAVSWRGKDATQEELELVQFVQLKEDALAEIRGQALDLEKSAYEKSPDVYAHTQPAELINSTLY